VILPGILSESQMIPLRRECVEYFRPLQATALAVNNGTNEKTSKFACDVIPWDAVSQGNAEFIRLNRDPMLRKVTELVIGPGFTEAGSLIMFSVAGGRGQAWHQDCPKTDGAGFNLNRLFYPEDISPADGAVVVVPGSHRRGTIPPGGHQESIEGEIPLTPRAGTLILLHGQCYHRVTPNLNSKPRVSINLRAFPAGVSKDVTCIGVYRNGTVNFCAQHKNHDGTAAMADTAP
jgi:hypothetical protein